MIMSNFTKSSFKKFIRDNKDRLEIGITSRFDSMTDCVDSVSDVRFIKIA